MTSVSRYCSCSDSVRRRLKAGESVELEDLQKAIDAPGNPVTIDAVCQAVNGPTRTTLEPAQSEKP